MTTDARSVLCEIVLAGKQLMGKARDDFPGSHLLIFWRGNLAGPA
ncbi:hypothetical protein [Methyloversatilis sp. XJ19-49]|nr:hypothetical protein [Methyloversatilis sp. XJ19-49]MCQ9379406.1 hypothetical protein [Methyloversatilis sp. XJ19-49]